MAVQAQNPSHTLLNDLRIRPGAQRVSAMDLCNLTNANANPNLDLRSLLLSFPLTGQDTSNLFLHSHSHSHSYNHNHHHHHHQQYQQSMILPPVATSMIPNISDIHRQQFNQMQNNAMENVSAPQRQRKRRKAPPMMSSERSPDLNKGHASALASAPINNNNNNNNTCVVSTGLRLALDDDRSTVTSSRPDMGTSMPGSTATASVSASGRMMFNGGDDISSTLLHQQDDLNQVIKIQIDQLRHALLDKMQSNAKHFLATVEEQLSHRMRDREVELERVNRRNMELEQRLKQIGMETHIWQSKAKSYEAMVAMLRANLQQALINQSREHIHIEGYGDNEAEDAISTHVDDSDGAQKTRALMVAMKETGSLPLVDMKRYCKKCMAMEACIVLVPCMHLCICSNCQSDVEKCPICDSQRSACVEVYLS